MIYLDHNATAPIDPRAARAAAAWLTGGPGNASSVHRAGRRARAAVEEARRAVGASLGVPPRELVFTSGATEALHHAVWGVARGAHVVASAVEHPALFGACAVAGAEVTRVPVDAHGRVEPAAFRAALRADTRLVALMGAQNELGNLYPVAAVAEAVAPVPLLCDAVQLWGKRALDLPATGASLAALSGHKIGAPAGVGVLWARPDVELRPFMAGGPQERGRRAGTENVAGLVGLGVAAGLVGERVARFVAVEALRDRLLAALLDRLPGFTLHGEPGLPNTLAFRVRGVEGDLLLAALDLEGVCISSGSACSAGAVEPSPVLRALGLGADAARGGLRVSLGPESTAAEIDALSELLPRLVAQAGGATQEVRSCAS